MPPGKKFIENVLNNVVRKIYVKQIYGKCILLKKNFFFFGYCNDIVFYYYKDDYFTVIVLIAYYRCALHLSKPRAAESCCILFGALCHLTLCFRA